MNVRHIRTWGWRARQEALRSHGKLPIGWLPVRVELLRLSASRKLIGVYVRVLRHGIAITTGEP